MQGKSYYTTKVDVLKQSLHTTVKSLKITDKWLRPKLIILTQGWQSQVNPKELASNDLTLAK